LWKELGLRMESGGLFSHAEFNRWDERVHALLTPFERLTFLKPLGPNVPVNEDTIQYARFKWFTSILWTRQGVETGIDNPDDFD
jgi:hypothetical protein